MGADPPGQVPPPRRQTMFSPDGFWWWDGSQWKAAVSADRLWRWNGQAWEPNRAVAAPPRGGGGGTATAVVVTILGFAAVAVLVSILVIVALLVMGNQLSNVFENVVTALGASPTPSPRTILHVDLDAFYTSVHQRDDPKLRGIPIAVAGRSRRAVVMGASYEARAYGVRSAMPLHEALQVCPQLTVVAPDGARYREASRVVHQIFRRFTSPELVEGVALDEAYLDVTARTRHGTSTADDVARRIKFQVHTEVGLTASVGAATSKLVAKVASGTRKPDGLVLVLPGTESDFLAPLPIGVIPGLGPKTEERLHAMGLRTVGALAAYETQRLVQALGTNGAVLQRLAQGRDRAPVDGSRPAKTISAETTFEDDVSDRAQLERALRDLTDRVTERLKTDGVRARTVYVKLKLPDFRLVSRQVSRTSPTDDVETIFRAARSALEKSHVESRPVRLIGVGLSGLEHPEPDLQMTLFD
ncbi:MAG: DNA polymerase IV [Chloroflexi bacterium]|nr:MAG: DNA polymerase IV [Chloroflexota bacterium]